MPCKDVTELIRVTVDANDCLAGYRFVKRTCGQGVGADALLADVLVGHPVNEILAIAPEDFIAAHPVTEEIEEFLGLKHLIAVQSALEVLIGRAPCGPREICAAAEIGFEDGDTVIEARILVDLVAERIRSCGGCKACGKSRKPRKVRALFN